MIDWDTVRVPVHGGSLQLTRWPGRSAGAPVVLAVHGITASSRSWDVVARSLNGAVTLLAPDLRGRGLSGTLPGPYGISAHVDDLLMVLEHEGIDRAFVVGHSMGAFVACVLGAQHPERTAGMVLVDGGVALPVQPDLDPDTALRAVIGPALDRLQMTFPTRQAYRAFWQGHPAFLDRWSPDIDAYVQYDLVGAQPQLHSSCNPEAVRTDGREVLFEPAVVSAIHELRCASALLWAERGLQDQPQGLYDDERLVAAGLDANRVRLRRIDDVNHYTVILGRRGADAVAAAIVQLVESVSGPSAVERDRRSGHEGRGG